MTLEIISVPNPGWKYCVTLRHLSRRDMFSEIMEIVGLDGKTAKHHLDKLEQSGLISSNWEGRRKYYSMLKEVILRISPYPNRRFEVLRRSGRKKRALKYV